MKQITFYLDFISPYAYLAFECLPEALMGLSYELTYKPVLFAAMLEHYGQLGPAEIVPKRTWTYRQMLWLGRERGVALQAPASHPFNPLPLLRLAIACGHGGACNRYQAETIFRHVWTTGLDAQDPARIQKLTEQLTPQRSVTDADVKAQLKTNTDEALAAEVFGVPSMVVDGQVFWGLDALPMMRQYLEGEPWFAAPQWTEADKLPVGLNRIK